ncbi:ABC1 kinase family protein [Streptomyces sp. NPDC059929]|uniref:ABC1 kinase family protein n=2 Tax=unclassified Streptomyces TaxID=2593676 RepID=UPI0036610728
MKVAEYVSAGVVFVVFLMAFAKGAGRLLGLRVGLIRAFLAGIVGIAALALFSLVMQRPEQGGFLTSVQFGSTFVVAMGFLAVTEIFLPGGLGPSFGWLLGLRARLARARRYSHISSIAVRHGLRPYLLGRRGASDDGRPRRSDGLARPLRLAFEEGGATFVKLGQMLSTRDDLLPPAFVAELSRLQYQVPSQPWHDVEAVLIQEYGRPVEEVFAEFDPEPLAAASIAQVHLARLKCGSEVVVKVQRPGIRPVVERDLEIMCRMSAMLEVRTRWARTLGLGELADGFARSVNEELDFRIEARNLAMVTAAWARRAESTGTRDALRLPAAYEELSSERVLVLERLPGMPISSAYEKLDTMDVDRRGLARSLLASALQQVLVDGTFHADPHPGNILLLDDGSIGLIDFGSVGRLDGRLKSGLRSFLLAVQQGDAPMLCDALLDVVARPEEINEQRLERDLGRFIARHLAPGIALDIQVFTQLLRLVSDHGLAMPPEVATVFRAFGTLEGTLTRISPGFDMMSESQLLVGERLSTPAGASASGDTVRGELFEALGRLRRIPRRLDRVTSALEQGRLTVGVRLFADARDRRYVKSLVQDVLLTFIGATTGILGAILLGIRRGPMLTAELGLFELLGYNLLVVSATLLVRVLFDISRPHR